jgi:hypothetical protein
LHLLDRVGRAAKRAFEERLLETLLQNASEELRAAADAGERYLIEAFRDYLEARLARLRIPKPPRDL